LVALKWEGVEGIVEFVRSMHRNWQVWDGFEMQGRIAMLSPGAYAVSSLGLVAFALLVFRVFIRASYQREGRLSWPAIFLEFIVFLFFGAFTWLDLPSGWPPQEVSPILRTIGWLSMAIGLSAMFILIFWFGWLRAMGRKVDILIQSGPYRISRNPQIVACFIAVVGYALLWPSWHTLGWVITFSVIVHLMVLTEEEHLRNVFGEKYLQSCAHVPRYLGVRWLFSRPAL
jgi:protein-S-isoprenylcysteine O-methyltransferase Ste14